VEEYCTTREATDYRIILRRYYAIYMPGVYYKSAEKHSEYVVLIAFLQQQWLRERSSMLRLYAHCLSL
jgi:hypothetical protein